MPASFWKTIKKAFSQRLPQHAPPFALPDNQPEKLRGLLFTARPAADLFFFIYLSPDKYCERFTIEVGWNRNDSYPFDQMSDSVFDGGGAYRKEVLKAESFRARIRTLVGLRELWWGPPQQSAAEMLRDFENIFSPAQSNRTKSAPDQKLIATVVSDALDRITTGAMPLFDAVTKARCCSNWRGATA